MEIHSLKQIYDKTNDKVKIIRKKTEGEANSTYVAHEILFTVPRKNKDIKLDENLKHVHEVLTAFLKCGAKKLRFTKFDCLIDKKKLTGDFKCNSGQSSMKLLVEFGNILISPHVASGSNFKLTLDTKDFINQIDENVNLDLIVHNVGNFMFTGKYLNKIIKVEDKNLIFPDTWFFHMFEGERLDIEGYVVPNIKSDETERSIYLEDIDKFGLGENNNEKDITVEYDSGSPYISDNHDIFITDKKISIRFLIPSSFDTKSFLKELLSFSEPGLIPNLVFNKYKIKGSDYISSYLKM